MPKRTKSSARWLSEHFTDTYVKRAQQGGWRSRAVFKLEDIQRRDHIIKPGMTVVDLGAAPGGWSQFTARVLAGRGKIVALDLLPMEPLTGVNFLQGDFTEESVQQRLAERLAGRSVNLVLSDMAPNITGDAAVDQPRAMHLAEQALLFARSVLDHQGVFLVKAFQGTGFPAYLEELRSGFRKTAIRKPKASRNRSRELYLLAKYPQV